MKRSVTGDGDWAAATKEKPLSYVGGRKTKALRKGDLGWIPIQIIVTNLYLYMELIQYLHVEEHKLIYPKLV